MLAWASDFHFPAPSGWCSLPYRWFHSPTGMGGWRSGWLPCRSRILLLSAHDVSLGLWLIGAFQVLWQTTAVAPSKTQGPESARETCYPPLICPNCSFLFCWQFYSYNFLIHIIHSFNTYNPVIFTIFIGLCNHHHHLILENFPHPNRKTCTD